MRRRNVILLTLGAVFILTAVIAYFTFYNQPSNEEPDTENKDLLFDDSHNKVEFDIEPIAALENTVAAESTDNAKILPSTRIVYQYYYTVDDKLIEEETEPPYYMLDMTRAQIEEYYPEWQLISFSNKKVVLRQAVNDIDKDNYYILKEHNGIIGIFYRNGMLRDQIDTPVSSLPDEEQKRLKEGITVYGEEELITVLENYTS